MSVVFKIISNTLSIITFSVKSCTRCNNVWSEIFFGGAGPTSSVSQISPKILLISLYIIVMSKYKIWPIICIYAVVLSMQAAAACIYFNSFSNCSITYYLEREKKYRLLLKLGLYWSDYGIYAAFIRDRPNLEWLKETSALGHAPLLLFVQPIPWHLFMNIKQNGWLALKR